MSYSYPFIQQPYSYQDQLSQLRNAQMAMPSGYQPARQDSSGLNWVQGETGAKSWIVAAEIFHRVVVFIVVNQIPTETLLPEISTPYMVRAWHILCVKAVGRQGAVYFVPLLPGCLADCPDGTVTHTTPRRVWVIVPV